MNSHRQRGAIKLKTIIGFAIVALMAYSGFKLVPPYIDNFQLLDSMKTEARFAAVNRKSPDDVREAIYKKIRELEIPAKLNDIRVDQVGVGGLRITVKYTVTVTILGYQHTIEFAPTADNMSI